MKRKKNSHKGQNGKILVIGGSEDFIGAPALAAKAAAGLRIGADLVFIACPEKVGWAISSMFPDVITIKLKGKYLNATHYKKILETATKADVILIGNGMGLKPGTKKLAARLTRTIKKPKVIDADALKSIRLQDVEHAVLTPHQKEFEILLKNSKLTEKNFRKYLKDNVILLKGPTDWIFSSDKKRKNTTGNPGMTVGGTGDVLAGITAGLLSQGCSLFDAAYKAAYLNGKIGDRLYKELGYGLIASDFLKEIAKEAKRWQR